MTTVFEKIIKGELSSEKVWENERFLVIKDRYPNAPIHLLILPKKHFPSLQAVGPEDIGMMGEIWVIIQELARMFKVDQSGYRIIVNNGVGGGQVIFHLHVHFLAGKKFPVYPESENE
ncbi:HIT-like protein [Candidatus Clavichlamydia salmonicola]|uniref:histidine triad nucleotide-binding protein n=1 Tax=Candidatus Clavichlamydia salmonicola TaxID=469812 RepID=UPI00189168D6|nr:histidine triad nucleotide-binding protein [Candidatus Clavichlamydia salmonicola]MBF5051090.1 HIT-like protein [Candidatus Clavichlamydia salmonicola]